MINSFTSKVSLFIFVFILLALSLPPKVLAVGESCKAFGDCVDANNMCVDPKGWGNKECYPKIGGGCNSNDDCAQIEPQLNIPGAFCDMSKAIGKYPGSCFSNQEAPKTKTEDGCSWKIERPVPGTAITQGGCFSVEHEEAYSSCSTIAKPKDFKPPEQSLHCCCPGETKAIVQAKPKFDPPQLQIQIPGLVYDKADVTCVNTADGGYSCSINWISKYIKAIYNYALSIGGILAALMLMAGGLLWLTSGGDSGKISKAKAFIGGSVTGLIILFSAYMILYEVNPELTKMKPISIKNAPSSGTPSSGSSTIVTTGWKWDTGIIDQIGDASPELSSFINCMRENLPDGIGRISSISDSNHIGELTICEQSNCSNCVHVCGSCHYGGGLGTNKSYAMDLGDEENKAALVTAANACGVSTNGPGFILDEGDHLHMSVPTCPRN